jgi:hypothetical protein
MNLTYTGSGSNSVWDALAELVSSISEEHAQYAVQPYYTIEIIPFLRSVSSGSFLRVIYPFVFVVPVNTPDRCLQILDPELCCSWSNWVNPLKQVSRNLPEFFAILRSLSQSSAITRQASTGITPWHRSQLGYNVAIWNHKFPSKLLFTHFMERSASVANIKCEEVAAYLPIYIAGYLGILSNSSEESSMEFPI